MTLSEFDLKVTLVVTSDKMCRAVPMQQKLILFADKNQFCIFYRK